MRKQSCFKINPKHIHVKAQKTKSLRQLGDGIYLIEQSPQHQLSNLMLYIHCCCWETWQEMCHLQEILVPHIAMYVNDLYFFSVFGNL